MQSKISLLIIALYSLTVVSIISCSKGDSSDPAPPPPPSGNPCEGKNIVVTASSTPAQTCGAGGTITVTATGSSNFTFKLNNGAYQTASAFSNVAAGNHTVYAKDGDGCETAAAVNVASTGTAGPLFLDVRQLMTARCVSCHNPSNLNGGKDWTVDCNIVLNADRIYQRAVVEGSMPATGPLPQNERDIIANWFNAGARYTD